MELEDQVLLICSQFDWISLVITVGLIYLQANRGCGVLAPGGSPLSRILASWSMYSHYPMSKEQLVYYCNIVCPMFILDHGEKWPLDGSLNYYTTMQLEQYCQWLDKWDKIHYVKAFVSLHNRVSPGTKSFLMAQRREVASKPFPDSKTQKKEKNEEISLDNALNPVDRGLAAG